jgi:ribosome biogenesis protein UTP30
LTWFFALRQLDTMAEDGRVKIKKSQLEKAIKALVQLNAKRSANVNPLFGANAETINVIFTLSQIPNKRKIKPMLIELPHPLFNEKSEVCFLAKDPQKQYKELLMQKHPVPGLTKVIGLEKLKKNYKTAESKRALADAFDLFLCDSRIVEMMPRILGSIFYEKKLKRPLPVRLKLGDPDMTNLKKAISGTTLRVPSGPCLGVRFGRCSMDEQHLVANAAAVISFVSKFLSNNPVQTISVQATDSPALPVWRRARPPGEALDLKKYHSDAMSSSASDTGISGGASETEDATSVHGSELPSDAGETFSGRASDTAGDSSMSELETGSELDSDAGDVTGNILPEHLPLLKGLKGKKKRLAGNSSAAKAETIKPESEAMPPPKKAKKSKKAT